jgi:hypothetical protein
MRQFMYIFTRPCFAGTATLTTGMWMTYTQPGGAASGAAAAVARAAVAAAVISAAGAASTDQRTGRAAGPTLTGRIDPPNKVSKAANQKQTVVDSPKISASSKPDKGICGNYVPLYGFCLFTVGFLGWTGSWGGFVLKSSPTHTVH